MNHTAKNCPSKKIREKSNTSDAKQSKSPAFSAIFSSGKFDKNDWYIDSGASHHMTMNENWLYDVTCSTIKEITIANESKIAVTACGKLNLETNCNGETKIIIE